jgi:hypothetical protein
MTAAAWGAPISGGIESCAAALVSSLTLRFYAVFCGHDPGVFFLPLSVRLACAHGYLCLRVFLGTLGGLGLLAGGPRSAGDENKPLMRGLPTSGSAGSTRVFLVLLF